MKGLWAPRAIPHAAARRGFDPERHRGGDRGGRAVGCPRGAGSRAAHPAPPRARLLLAAAALVLAAWLGASAFLHVRAQRERSQTTAMLRADRELTELSTLRWRTLLGAIGPEDALAAGRPVWHRLARAIAEAGDPALQDRLTAMAIGSGAPCRPRSRPVPHGPPIAGDAVAKELHAYDEAIDRRVVSGEVAARRDMRHAWELSAAGGDARLVLVVLLLAGFVRTARAAQRLRTRAARSEGERRALRESERRFRALVQHASDVVVVLDADGLVTFATDAVSELLGAAPAELIGSPFAELAEDAARDRLGGMLDEIHGRPARSAPS